MASRDATNLFAPCCLGNNCRLVDLTNGACPLAATSRHCVVCNGVLHPLCGEVDSRSSLLTCFKCIAAFGQSFETQEPATLFVHGLANAGADGTYSPAGDESPAQDSVVAAVIQESEHERLVKETKRRMMPDECPRLNRSQSTIDNNRNELVKLIMWLMGHHNECSDESKVRQALLVDDVLTAEVQAGRTDREKRSAIRKWLDWEESPPPFKFDEFYVPRLHELSIIQCTEEWCSI
ncbi:hypothetical protein MHU86_1723 [Fragilaria crotonensis]|nr:hypothetical protein MHU86_1723 [Fragilaria crotonensis]